MERKSEPHFLRAPHGVLRQPAAAASGCPFSLAAPCWGLQELAKRSEAAGHQEGLAKCSSEEGAPDTKQWS